MGSYYELLIICLAGMFGGFIYSLQNGGMVLPHRTNENQIHLGFIANCLFGIAGALVIFLIVPGKFNFVPNSSEFIKSLATALVGGWGGIALVDKVLGNTVQQLEEKIEAKERQEFHDANVLELTDQYLSSSSNVELSEDKLIDSIKKSSPRTKMSILNNAQNARSVTWRKNKARMARTIPVLKALAQSDRQEATHRIFGQLGFALKDQTYPDYKGARTNLSKAIEIRNNHDIKGFAWYEFSRAICSIYMDNDFLKNQPTTSSANIKEILQDFTVAFKDDFVVNQLKRSHCYGKEDPDVVAIKKWLFLNNLTPTQVGLTWLDTV